MALYWLQLFSRLRLIWSSDEQYGYGLLVANGDMATLSTALDRLMSDSLERKRLASRAPEVLERFGGEHVLALWDDLFTSLTAR